MKLGLTQLVQDKASFVVIAPVSGKSFCCASLSSGLTFDSLCSLFFGLGSSEFKNTLSNDNTQNILCVPLDSLLSGTVWALAFGKPGFDYHLCYILAVWFGVRVTAPAALASILLIERAEHTSPFSVFACAFPSAWDPLHPQFPFLKYLPPVSHYYIILF